MSNESNKIETSRDKLLFKSKSDAGKGDKPRNISRQYWDNWEEIKGFRKSKYR